MKILFTGASSFTGYWFVGELCRAGHEVTATFTAPADVYEGLRKDRIDGLDSSTRKVFECRFGDENFVELAKTGGPWDLLSHHAADVTNYKSPDFDVGKALDNNTKNLETVLEVLKAQGCQRVVATGSVFEQDEGAGSEGLPAFSPYGLSKGLTAQVLRYHCEARNLSLGKFVIPNPFGPYEEPRFTAYLVRTWFTGKTAGVKTPAYVRDNIHVGLLAKAYAKFVGDPRDSPEASRVNPSGYAESQGAFAERFAANLRPRLDLACELDLEHQVVFEEPRVRINTDIPDAAALDWSEDADWDRLARYYQMVHAEVE